MVHLREAILAILYDISLGADPSCPLGLILTDAAYKRSLRTTVVFNCMTSAYKSNDPIIKDDATDGLCKKMYHEWTAWLATQSLIRSCKIGCRSFILKVVEDTWFQRLCDPDSFYTCVAPKDLFNLLSTYSGGLERVNVIAMFATMHLWWAEDPPVPKFINRFDDAQKKFTRTSLPIANNYLADMATSALLSSNSFPNDFPACDGLVPSVQTWTAWKIKFVPLHSSMKRELRDSS